MDFSSLQNLFSENHIENFLENTKTSILSLKSKWCPYFELFSVENISLYNSGRYWSFPTSHLGEISPGTKVHCGRISTASNFHYVQLSSGEPVANPLCMCVQWPNFKGSLSPNSRLLVHRLPIHLRRVIRGNKRNQTEVESTAKRHQIYARNGIFPFANNPSRRTKSVDLCYNS